MKYVIFILWIFAIFFIYSCCTKKDCTCLTNENISLSFNNTDNDTITIKIIDKSNGLVIEKKITNSYLYLGSFSNLISKSILDYTYIINYNNISDTIKKITNTNRISSGVCNKCFIVFDGDKYNCKLYENYKININNKTIEGNEIIY